MKVYILLEGSARYDRSMEPVAVYKNKIDAENYIRLKESKVVEHVGKNGIGWVENACGDFEIAEFEVQ